MTDGDDRSGGGWLSAVRYALIALGIGYLGLALVGTTISPDDVASGAQAFLTRKIFVFAGGFMALLHVAAAWGLGYRKRWSWYLGFALGLIYTPCIPFGLLIVYGLLRPRVRKLYLDDPA